ncbi:MAG: phosphoribosylformylglycinamidine cyclo-ligase [Thermanaerothrix sp.]|nr:phosphoribosylformylglycinamidine cyclo-ligase [Thermanaerothrix sp.]
MGLTYDKSGVSLSAADLWVERVKEIVKKHPINNSQTIAGIGGFAGLYRISDHLALAACCDGVGTKMELARELGKVKGLGQDLVAMNVNDLVTCGARPLFFLDYVACGKLKPDSLLPILEGIAESCAACGCTLLGGETAEMPQVYDENSFDLAGFAVGIVATEEIITGESIVEGDLLIGLPSSGPHSNGYSLIRKAVGEAGVDLNSNHGVLPSPLGEELLRPTRLYVNQALKGSETGLVKAMAHITGGSLEGNISRVIPPGLGIQIDYQAWRRPAIFEFLQGLGIDEAEMRRVFNLGVGFVMIASPKDVDVLLNLMTQLGEAPFIIGSVTRR